MKYKHIVLQWKIDLIGLLIVLVVTTSIVNSYAENECQHLSDQFNTMSVGEVNDVNRYGFAYSLSNYNEFVPEIYISDSIVRDCKVRVIAARYFYNKINGMNKYKIDRDEFSSYKKQISFIAYSALTHGYNVWRDGTSHEIYHIVVDLWPEWNEFLVKYLTEYVSGTYFPIEVFPKGSFSSPTESLIVALDAFVDRPGSGRVEAAIGYFFKKNFGYKLNIDDVEKELILKSDPYVEQRFDKEFDVVGKAVELLSKDSKITYGELLGYMVYAYGDESL